MPVTGTRRILLLQRGVGGRRAASAWLESLSGEMAGLSDRILPLRDGCGHEQPTGSRQKRVAASGSREAARQSPAFLIGRTRGRPSMWLPSFLTLDRTAPQWPSIACAILRVLRKGRAIASLIRTQLARPTHSSVVSRQPGPMSTQEEGAAPRGVLHISRPVSGPVHTP